jgi:hypothetical protein
MLEFAAKRNIKGWTEARSMKDVGQVYCRPGERESKVRYISCELAGAWRHVQHSDSLVEGKVQNALACIRVELGRPSCAEILGN